MRSIFASKRFGIVGALLLALGLFSGHLNAQGVEDLAPPGEDAPATTVSPDGGGLLDFDIAKPSEADEHAPLSGKDKKPTLRAIWSPLPGHPNVAVLAIQVEMQKGANTYDFVPVKGSKPTKIQVEPVSGATPIDENFVADREPELIDGPAAEPGDPKLREYLREVTFLRRYKITGEPPARMTGKIDFQVCRVNCILYKEEISAEWSSDPYVGEMPTAWRTSGGGTPAEGSAGESEAAIEVVKSGVPLSLGYALMLAFLGGVIMNIMPCVLPVIAIKVLSFVQQAGESRSRIFALNLTYAVGVIAVFLGLGTLATFARIGLGQLFQYDGFNVVMACVVFAMGLSLLGVFEFQLPGSVGGANEHEGLAGAFFTGILATLLATPCIGPFVSGVLVWSVTQPTAVIYLIWGTLGLGMASPYLLIGLFPSLINRMPRPGMWMVRFKEFSGFVLMATVIFLINSISPTLLIPTLVILLGIALALWMMGNLYDHSTPVGQKWKVRLAAAVISLPLIGWGVIQHVGIERVYAILHLEPPTQELPWQPFSQAKLVELRKSGQPVLIDFTADWCAVCKTNEKLALNTKATAEFIRTHNVACLKADYTDESAEITVWLQRFGAAGVPLTVIFPPGEKAKGIPFDGLFTQSGLLTAMEEAWKQSGEKAPVQAMALEKKSSVQ